MAELTIKADGGKTLTVYPSHSLVSFELAPKDEVAVMRTLVDTYWDFVQRGNVLTIGWKIENSFGNVVQTTDRFKMAQAVYG